MIPPGWMAFGYVLEILVAAVAVHLARSRSYHAPAARYLFLLVLADLVRGALMFTVLPSSGPHTGALRILYNLDQLLTLVEPVGLAWLSLAVFWPARIAWRERLLAVGAFVGALIVTTYPRLRDNDYQHVLLAVWTAAQVTAWTAAIAWRVKHLKAWPSLTQRLVLIYAAGQLVAQGGPVIAGSIFKHWEVGFGALVLLQLVATIQQALWLGAPLDREPPRSPRRRR